MCIPRQGPHLCISLSGSIPTQRPGREDTQRVRMRSPAIHSSSMSTSMLILLQTLKGWMDWRTASRP